VNKRQHATKLVSDFLKMADTTQRGVCLDLDWSEKRFSERVRGGTLYLADFLALLDAYPDEAAALLQMMTNDYAHGLDRDCPRAVSQELTEASASAQKAARIMDQDGRRTANELREVGELCREVRRLSTLLNRAIDEAVPGPIPMEAAE
jgi:hypothetical protein